MYEMQGPRFGRSVQTRRLPRRAWIAGAISVPLLSPSYHRPGRPEKSRLPGHSLLSKESPKERSKESLKIPKVSLKSLRVTPVFAGREISTPLAQAAQDLLTTNFKILYCPPLCPPNTASYPQPAGFSTDVIHSVVWTALGGGRRGRGRGGRARPGRERSEDGDYVFGAYVG